MTKKFLYALQIPETIAQSEYEWLLQQVSAEKREKVERYRHIQDSYRSLLGELLVRSFISEHYQVDNRQISFIYNQYGKPELALNLPFSFNLSHSGCWVVCLCSPHTASPVGVDIERIKNVNLDIARRFFTNKEYEDLISRHESERVPYFYTLWALKESYIKYTGKGLSEPLDSFSFRMSHNQIEFESHKKMEEKPLFSLYNLDPNYKLAACAENALPKYVVKVTYDEFKLRYIIESR